MITQEMVDNLCMLYGFEARRAADFDGVGQPGAKCWGICHGGSEAVFHIHEHANIETTISTAKRWANVLDNRAGLLGKST